MVAPYSGDIFAIVARSASDSSCKPSPDTYKAVESHVSDTNTTQITVNRKNQKKENGKNKASVMNKSKFKKKTQRNKMKIPII